MRTKKYFHYIAMPLFGLMLGFTALFVMPGNTWAVDLHAAKASGLVGEQLNGYLGVIKGGADVRKLVATINSKRRAHYQKIAAKNSTTLSAVEALAGKNAQAKTVSGQYIMRASGRWVRK
ncbi:MAG: YdbL family protein [Mariprofundus sp.]